MGWPRPQSRASTGQEFLENIVSKNLFPLNFETRGQDVIFEIPMYPIIEKKGPT